jgi:hypothetical protein
MHRVLRACALQIAHFLRESASEIMTVIVSLVMEEASVKDVSV